MARHSSRAVYRRAEPFSATYQPSHPSVPSHLPYCSPRRRGDMGAQTHSGKWRLSWLQSKEAEPHEMTAEAACRRSLGVGTAMANRAKLSRRVNGRNA
jgi:hypothetical protein